MRYRLVVATVQSRTDITAIFLIYCYNRGELARNHKLSAHIPLNCINPKSALYVHATVCRITHLHFTATLTKGS